MADDTFERDYEEGDWGTDKADYYNADVIETEQDALEEEAEARRLQQKQLAGLNAADFGFDDLSDEDVDGNGYDAADGVQRDTVTEILPQLQLKENMGPAERLKLLHSLYPELEHLRKEHINLQPILEDLQAVATSSRIAQIKRLALSSYMTCLSMYFALLGSPASKRDPGDYAAVMILPPQRVRSHPIMARLVKSRDLWMRVQDLDEESEASEAEDALVPTDLSKPLAAPIDESLNKGPSKKRKRKSKAERAAEAAATAAEEQRQARIRRAQEDLADLSSIITKRPSKRASDPQQSTSLTKPTTGDSDSDFGDEVALTAEEAAEKARKKKSLRFYTSQIAQKTNKRERKGAMAGGDDDIPYRERFRDRQARTMENPEERYMRGKNGDEGTGSDDDDEGVDNDLTQIKAAKRRRQDDGEALVDGKRKIGRDIEKNKGLTPFRKKEVRNPRVKKRMRYEDKKKKLGSRKAVYKGGEGKGGYGGERTGINSNVIKSVRLS